MKSLTPAIVICAYNRINSIGRLLRCVSECHYPSDLNIPLVISIDGGGDYRITELADSFIWKFGKKYIIKHSIRLGLKKHILTCADLTEKFGSIILLEDDIIVSPDYYNYASEAGAFYADNDKIAQISLYSYEHGELELERFYPLKNEYDVYFMQWASSWGQLWMYSQWRSFRTWYDNLCDQSFEGLQIPEKVKRWPETSWKKYFIGYLYDQRKFVVYPYNSYTSVFGDSGENVKTSSLPVAQVPLVWKKANNLKLPDFEETSIKYDAYFQPTKGLIDSITKRLLEYDYAVDLQGTKSLNQIDKPYLLSVKQCNNPIYEFGWNIFPLELNVCIDHSGSSNMFFGKTSDYTNRIPGNRKFRLVFWSKRLLNVQKTFWFTILKVIYNSLGFLNK